jgi:hypothetical protein
MTTTTMGGGRGKNGGVAHFDTPRMRVKMGMSRHEEKGKGCQKQTQV